MPEQLLPILLGGAKELGIVYINIIRGAEELRNLQSHRGACLKPQALFLQQNMSPNPILTSQSPYFTIHLTRYKPDINPVPHVIFHIVCHMILHIPNRHITLPETTVVFAGTVLGEWESANCQTWSLHPGFGVKQDGETRFSV